MIISQGHGLLKIASKIGISWTIKHHWPAARQQVGDRQPRASKQYFLNLFFGGKINRSKHLAEQYPLVWMRMTQNEF